jgi:hypothetical protein
MRLRFLAWSGWCLLALVLTALACSPRSDRKTHKALVIRASYSLDAINFLNVLTDDPFYTKPHEEAYAYWFGKTSARSRAVIREVAEARGSNMLGPWLAYMVSDQPHFDEAAPARLLDGFSDSRALAPVIDELEKQGFRDYWERDRLPEISRKVSQMQEYLDKARFSLEAETARLKGPGSDSDDEPWRLYICAFAAPHGIRLSGKALIADVRNEPKGVLRIAIHEMFHPPYGSWQAWWTRRRLTHDPLFQEAFKVHDARRFGYADEEGFLEENIVEAMELHVSQRLGLIDDPWKYLARHDRGDHRLSVVLLDSFNQWPKRDDETFPDYLKRVVATLPDDLRPLYQARMSKRE